MQAVRERPQPHYMKSAQVIRVYLGERNGLNLSVIIAFAIGAKPARPSHMAMTMIARWPPLRRGLE
jgi:hypothetical protein